MSIEVDDWLAHYGVKGMRWGVVNEDKPSGNDRRKKLLIAGGGVKDVTTQIIKATTQNGIGVDSLPVNSMIRFGTRSEKIYTRFADPLNRKDFAGRTITHDIILPELKALGVKTFEQARDLVWDEVKDTYQTFYEESLNR